MDKVKVEWKNKVKTAWKLTYTGVSITMLMVLYSADLWSAVVFIAFTCQYELYVASYIPLEYLSIHTGFAMFAPYMCAIAVILLLKQQLVRSAVRTREILSQMNPPGSSCRMERRKSFSNQNRKRNSFLVLIAFLFFSSAMFGCSLFCHLNTVQGEELHAYIMNGSFSHKDQFEKISKAWDEVQYNGKCCGINNYTDFSAMNLNMPDTCCHSLYDSHRRLSSRPLPPLANETKCRRDARMLKTSSQYLKTRGCFSIVVAKVGRMNTAFSLVAFAYCLDILGVLFVTYFEIKNYFAEKRSKRIRKRIRESLGLVAEEVEVR